MSYWAAHYWAAGYWRPNWFGTPIANDTAFQSDAFQSDAFQVAVAAAEQTGGGGRPKRRPRRPLFVQPFVFAPHHCTGQIAAQLDDWSGGVTGTSSPAGERDLWTILFCKVA